MTSRGRRRTYEIWLWHRQLGYASFGYSKKLFHSLFRKCDASSLRCDIYDMAKSHCVSILLIFNKNLTPFILIHFDVQSQLSVNHVRLILLLKTILRWHNYAWWRPKFKWSCCFKIFTKWLELNTMQRHKFSIVTMVGNIIVLMLSNTKKKIDSR